MHWSGIRRPNGKILSTVGDFGGLNEHADSTLIIYEGKCSILRLKNSGRV